MNFQLSKEQRDIKSAAREFAEGEIRDIAKEYDQREEFPMYLWKKACEFGFVGVFIKDEYGVKEGGTVTAGNSSGINDGAAAVVLMSSAKVKELGIQPMARIVDKTVVGVDPDYMGDGPIPATRKILEKTGLTLKDIGLIEINEAFAAPYLACERALGLDREITNVNGKLVLSCMNFTVEYCV